MKDLPELIAAEIETDIRDRRGLQQAFEAIDDETQAEIREEWARLIRSVLDFLAEREGE